MARRTLLLPVAGRSSRYPGMRPKWLLTHPRGTLMLTESIRGLDPSAFDRIVVVALASHERDYAFVEPLLSEFSSEHGLTRDRLQVVLLERETRSQPETIAEGLRRAGVEGSFLVKDSDNYFHLPAPPGDNFVAVIDLNKTGPLLVGNKSYVRPGADGRVESIVEKRVVSHLFACGGYHFADAGAYLRAYEGLEDRGQLYPSMVIQHMIDGGADFRCHEAGGFEDWGTLRDWMAFKRRYATLMVELDGVLVVDSHRHFDPKWGRTEALRRNAMAVNSLYDSGRVEVVVLSSRTPDLEQATRDQLRKNSIRFHRLLMNLPTGCTRILVGGFSENAPYEAARAVNLRVNDDRLDEMLQDLLP